MQKRWLSAVAMCAAITLLAGCQSGGEDASPREATSKPTTREARATRTPKGIMEHRRDELALATIQDGTLHHTTYDDAGVIRLRDPKADYPLSGTWTSPTIATDFDFTELLPSWNVTVPDASGVQFEVRVRGAESKKWSPWLYIGYWGRVLRDGRVTSFDGGKVDIDTLVLSKPADAYEIRARLQEFRPDGSSASPLVRKLSVVYSRPMPEDPNDRAEPATKPSTQPTTLPASVDLPVPFRAQGVESKSIRSSICSPTSVAMLLAWAGKDVPTTQCAMEIWDDDYALFGNWNRAVQFAGSLGYDAHLERFSSMDEARAMLASGQPIIASIRFKKGTFPSNLQKSTAGHLIVLRGYDTNGDIIVNDPASKDRGHGIVYKTDELAIAWLVNTGGVGYVIKKK